MTLDEFLAKLAALDLSWGLGAQTGFIRALIERHLTTCPVAAVAGPQFTTVTVDAAGPTLNLEGVSWLDLASAADGIDYTHANVLSSGRESMTPHQWELRRRLLATLKIAA